MLSICVGIVSVFMLIIRLFPALLWDMGMNPNTILTILGILMPVTLCVMLWMFRWIHYDNETFTYRNAFGIKKTNDAEAKGGGQGIKAVGIQAVITKQLVKPHLCQVIQKRRILAYVLCHTQNRAFGRGHNIFEKRKDCLSQVISCVPYILIGAVGNIGSPSRLKRREHLLR